MTRTIISVVDPVWGDSEQHSILCQVTTQEAGGPLPFNAIASDPELHGKQFWQELVAGKYGPIAAYTPPVTMQTPGKGPHVIA